MENWFIFLSQNPPLNEPSQIYLSGMGDPSSLPPSLGPVGGLVSPPPLHMLLGAQAPQQDDHPAGCPPPHPHNAPHPPVFVIINPPPDQQQAPPSAPPPLARPPPPPIIIKEELLEMASLEEVSGGEVSWRLSGGSDRPLTASLCASCRSLS